jgi:hypothetical protein
MSNVIDLAPHLKAAIQQEYEAADQARREAAQGDFRCEQCVEEWTKASERYWVAWRRHMDATVWGRS